MAVSAAGKLCIKQYGKIVGRQILKGQDITVKLRGGDLIVNYTDEGITLTGGAELVYNGVVED